MEVRCQLPSSAVGTPLRFNSSASALWETKPATISFRMVGAKARARDSAARLFAEAAASIPGGRAEVFLLACSIGPSWPDLGVLSEAAARDKFGVRPADNGSVRSIELSLTACLLGRPSMPRRRPRAGRGSSKSATGPTWPRGTLSTSSTRGLTDSRCGASLPRPGDQAGRGRSSVGLAQR
jgi:hypothetical protein